MAASAKRLRMCRVRRAVGPAVVLGDRIGERGFQFVVDMRLEIRKPLKPSLRTMRTTVGVDTPACWAMVVMEPSADIR